MNQFYLFNILTNKGKWTEEENRRFDLAYATYGKNWKLIARAVGTRSIIQVRSHAQKVLPRLESTEPPPSESSKASCSNNTDQGEVSVDLDDKHSKTNLANISIHPDLYGVWAYHTLKAVECFQLIQNQNSVEGSISRSREEDEIPDDGDTKTEGEARKNLQGIE